MHYVFFLFISENRVAEQKAQKKLGLAGTETPIGPPSGDEAEVEQWNKDSEAPRGKDVHDETDEESSGELAGSGDFEKNCEDVMKGECDANGDNGGEGENMKQKCEGDNDAEKLVTKVNKDENTFSDEKQSELGSGTKEEKNEKT